MGVNIGEHEEEETLQLQKKIDAAFTRYHLEVFRTSKRKNELTFREKVHRLMTRDDIVAKGVDAHLAAMGVPIGRSINGFGVLSADRAIELFIQYHEEQQGFADSKTNKDNVLARVNNPLTQDALEHIVKEKFLARYPEFFNQQEDDLLQEIASIRAKPEGIYNYFANVMKLPMGAYYWGASTYNGTPIRSTLTPITIIHLAQSIYQKEKNTATSKNVAQQPTPALSQDAIAHNPAPHNETPEPLRRDAGRLFRAHNRKKKSKLKMQLRTTVLPDGKEVLTAEVSKDTSTIQSYDPHQYKRPLCITLPPEGIYPSTIPQGATPCSPLNHYVLPVKIPQRKGSTITKAEPKEITPLQQRSHDTTQYAHPLHITQPEEDRHPLTIPQGATPCSPIHHYDRPVKILKKRGPKIKEENASRTIPLRQPPHDTTSQATTPENLQEKIVLQPTPKPLPAGTQTVALPVASQYTPAHTPHPNNRTPPKNIPVKTIPRTTPANTQTMLPLEKEIQKEVMYAYNTLRRHGLSEKQCNAFVDPLFARLAQFRAPTEYHTKVNQFIKNIMIFFEGKNALVNPYALLYAYQQDILAPVNTSKVEAKTKAYHNL